MKSRTARYGFINAKLRAGIEKLFSKQFFLSLFNADDIEQLIEMLRDTSYREAVEIYNSTGKLEDFERRVYSEGIYLLKSIVKHVPDDAAQVMKALLMKYEIENIKYAIRNLLYSSRSGKDFDKGYLAGAGIYIDEEMVHRVNWRELIQSETFDELMRHIKGSPYFEVISAQVVEFPEKNAFDIEVALDKYYYTNLLSAIRMLEGVDREIAGKIIGIKIDVENIRNLIRIKRYYQNKISEPERFFIHGGGRINDKLFKSSAGSEFFPGPLAEDKHTSLYFAGTEKNIDISRTTTTTLEFLEIALKKIFMEESRKPLLGYPFTIGVVLAFVFLKLDEIENLLAVVYTKVYSMDVDRVRAILE